MNIVLASAFAAVGLVLVFVYQTGIDTILPVAYFVISFLIFVFAYVSEKVGVTLTRNFVFVLSVLEFIIVLFYWLMFGVIDLSTHVAHTSVQERTTVVAVGLLTIVALLSGASLMLPRKRRVEVEITQHKALVGDKELLAIFSIGLISILVAGVAYTSYFMHIGYEELHARSGGVWDYLWKGIYFVFAVPILYTVHSVDLDRVKWHLVVLTISFFVVFGIFYKLRSPIMYYLLLLLFLFGHRVNKIFLLSFGIVIAVVLAAIALFRDPNLTDGRSEIMGVVNMFLGLGEQAHSIIWSIEYVDMHGLLYGWGVVCSFIGACEAIAVSYSRELAPLEYFEAGGGLGFFLPADSILNFGVSGSLLFMFVLGATIMYLQRRRLSRFELVVFSSLFANSFNLVRNDFGGSLRASLYTILAVAIVGFGVRAIFPRRTFLVHR